MSAAVLDVPLAFGSGILTAAAPCILPMLPFLLGAASGGRGRIRPLFIVLGFVATFSVFAWVFGRSASLFGISHASVRNGAILLLAVFGVLMIWPRPLEAAAARFGGTINRFHALGSRAGAGNLGGLLLGASMGAVWTPCAGPALGAILALLASADDGARAILLLTCYALGAALPMLAIAYGGQALTARVRGLARHAERMRMAGGVLVLLAAFAMFYQYDTLLTVWLTTFV